MTRFRSKRLLYVGALLLSVCVTSVQAKHNDGVLSGWQKLENAKPAPEAPAEEPIPRSIEDLLHERLERERASIRSIVQPALVRIEANYIRTTGSGEVVLHESSFHLEPRYRAFTAEGRDTLTSINSHTSPQPVMYFLGYARTPLALPMVSNLSEALKGDEAAYTIQLGILPLPKSSTAPKDSVKFYVIIERAIESNRSESMVNIERYAKEFTVKEGEPVQLRLENTPPEKRAYIIKLEDNSILDFYEDFARHFNEHIWLNAESLTFGLGKAELSPSTARLSIPYTVGRSSRVKVELVSVIDSTPTLEIIDTIKNPADYLAELDVRPLANGPYKYRFTAHELQSNALLYSATHDFVKRSPIMVPPPERMASATDTLEVGGKRENLAKMLASVTRDLAYEQAKTERLDETVQKASRDRDTWRSIAEAQGTNSIAGVRMRAGLGFLGNASGMNAFLGIEAKSPRLSLDVSFGVSGSMPFLSYTKPENFSKTFSAPKSLGVQLTYVLAKPFGDWAQPVAALGYYGVWSEPSDVNGLRSATLLSPAIGLNFEPFGADHSVGFTILFPAVTFGLGIDEPAQLDGSAKIYFRL